MNHDQYTQIDFSIHSRGLLRAILEIKDGKIVVVDAMTFRGETIPGAEIRVTTFGRSPQADNREVQS